MRILVVVAGLLICVNTSGSAAVIHVPGDSLTIQAGIDGAVDGDTVLVGNGIYSGHGNCDLDFGGKAIVLQSVNGSEATIIDCAGDSTHHHRAMIVQPVSAGVPVVKGFAITGGYADSGSAILCEDGSSIMIDSCVFRGNYSTEWGTVVGFDSCTFTITNCLFEDNFGAWIGGISFWDYGTLALENSVFRRNNGGAVSFWMYCSATVDHCLFERNSGGGYYCGGLGTTVITGTTFFANEGVGIVGFETELIMDRCLIAFGMNHATLLTDPPTVSCCNIYGNAGGDWDGNLAFLGWENGNVSFDPHFCDTAAGDLRVTDRSPCAPAHNACGVQIGALPVGCTDSLNVWRIKPDGSGDLPTIQDAVNSCYHYGDTIICDSGLYTGDGNRNLDFHGKRIVLRSQYGPEHTVIDARGTASDPARVFVFRNREDASAIIDGFTICGGHREGMAITEGGGGILCILSSPTFTNCRFTDNVSGIGGALACIGRASPTMNRCVFFDNSATMGGAVYCFDQSWPVLDRCTIANNAVTQSGSALVCLSNSRPRIDYSIIVFNEGDVPVSCFQSDPPFISCSDIFAHESGDWVGCIATQAGVEGNFSAHPWFCDPDSKDFHVDRFGPCSPEHSPCGELIGACDVDCACNCPVQGDCDDDGLITPTDLVYLIDYTLRGGAPLLIDEFCPLLNRGEFNCDGWVNLVDVVMMINFVYKASGVAPCDPCTP